MLVIKNCRIFDSVNKKILTKKAILIKDNTIYKIEDEDKLKSSQSDQIVDAKGKTIIPGMIDCHLHTAMFNCMTFHNFRVAQWEIRPELQQMYSLFHAQMCFDMGFTTLRDLGLATSRGLLTAEICAVRDSIDLGLFPGPRMLVAGWSHITGSHLDLIMPRAAVRQKDQCADGPYELRKQTREKRHQDVSQLCSCNLNAFSQSMTEHSVVYSIIECRLPGAQSRKYGVLLCRVEQGV